MIPISKTCRWIGCLAFLALPLVAGAQCVQVSDVSGSLHYDIIPSWDTMLVYDTAEQLTLGLTETNGVVTYDGSTWTFGVNVGLPSPVSGGTAGWVYDSARQMALRYGGADYNTFSFVNTLYAWNPDGWHQLTWTGPSPPAGEARAAFDPTRGRAIFLIAPGDSTWQTWEWTGSVWEQGPTLSADSADVDCFTFVTKRNIGFVGARDSGGNQTVWFYTPGGTAAQGRWTQANIANPYSALVGAALTYDPFRDRVMRCFGKDVAGLYSYADTIYAWDWINSQWSLFDYLPGFWMRGVDQGRAGAGAAYDLNRDKLVMYGGLVYHVNPSDGESQFDYHHDTWEQTDNSPGYVSSSTGSFADCVGDSTVFAITPVNGDVQWFHGGTPITNATSSLLVLNNLTTDDAGNYVARVQNDCGYIDTPIIHLRVDTPITLFRQALFPNCSQTCIGTNITINPPLPVYTGVDLNTHLQKNIGSALVPVWVDVRVDTPTAPADFVFTNVDKSFTGPYRFYIDGSACLGIVASITNYIQVGFDITSQPQSLSNVSPCSVVKFSVSTIGGCSLTYQWYSDRRGILFEDGHFSGTTSPSLTINGTHFDDEDMYFCSVIDTGQCNDFRWSERASLTMTLPQWVLRTTNGPSPRYANAMAYDSQRGVTVMYGGGVAVENTGYLGYGEVWEWDGAKWRQRTTYDWTRIWHHDTNGYWVQNFTDTPAARMQHAMTYDSRRGRIVLFGGRGAIATNIYSDFTFGDTWEWDGTRWYLGATNGLEPRFNCHLGYDPVRGVSILYGGFGVPANEIWEWDGAHWTSIIYTNGPVNHYNEYACQVFDTYLNTLFVGPTDDGFGYNHFYWTWDGHHWLSRALGFLFGSNFTPINGNMVYDTYRSRALHFGGQINGANNMYGGTAAGYYDSASDSWSVLPDEALSSNFGANDFLNVPSLIGKLGSQTDPVSQYLWSNLAPNDQQTLTNSGVSITQKQNTLAFAFNNIISNNIVYDTNRFAGVALSPETVVFHDLNPVAEDLIRFNRLLIEDAYPAEVARCPSFPTGRDQFAMAFDSARRCAVVMGGFYNGPGLNPLNGSDTWELMYLDTPLINDQPASQYRAPGDTAVFSVNAVAPYGSILSYQWYFGSVPLADGGRISGAHSPILQVASVDPTDAGQYQARISAACGTIYTAPAILTTRPGLQIFSVQSGAAQLVWSAVDLVLQQADSANGPWSTVPGASSPFDLSLQGAGKFFRLALPSP